MRYDPDDALEGVLVLPAYSASFVAPGQAGPPLEPPDGEPSGGCRRAKGAIPQGAAFPVGGLVLLALYGFLARKRR